MHPATVRKVVPTANEAARRVQAANQRLLQSTKQENLEFALNEFYGAIVVLAAGSCILAESAPMDLIPDADDFAKLVREVMLALEHGHIAEARHLAFPVT